MQSKTANIRSLRVCVSVLRVMSNSNRLYIFQIMCDIPLHRFAQCNVEVCG